MENIIKLESSSSDFDIQQSDFPVPFTIEALRLDILALYFQQVRTIGWMASADEVWKLIERKNITDENIIFDPDITPQDIGFEYESISKTSFAMSIEYMYQYAYYGILDDSYEPLEHESIHMWISAILSDMANSWVEEEWNNYGAAAISNSPANRCLEVAELANARSILEGANCYVFHFSGKGRDDAVDMGCLTVRQMALLSGMEEMSIRAAANPKRANPLQTYSVEGRTRISLEEAKKWLKSKGRYVPIQRKFSSNDIDITKYRFSSIRDLAEVSLARLQMFGGSEVNHLDPAMEVANDIVMRLFEYNSDVIKKPENVELLANALQFNPKIFSIRVREVLANEELSLLNFELNELLQNSDS